MQTISLDLDPADLAICKELLQQGSKSFSLASLLLPRRVREPATAIYAFCRVADDLVDEGSGGTEVLDRLGLRLEKAYEGKPEANPIDRAFSSVVRAYDIPYTVPAALLEGFAWDSQGRTYEHMEEVLAYSARVAGTVGVMMTLLMGPRDPRTLERACDLGVAMQLTNIARDVGQDARNGRVYLPGSWLREEGIEREALLRDPASRPELARVVKRLLNQAEQLYLRSDAGIAMLPRDCRPAILAARLIYAEIGHQLERNGLDSISRRTVVGKAKKLWLVLRAWLGATWGNSIPQIEPTSYEALEQTRFLVEASARAPSKLLPAPRGMAA